MTIGKPHLFQLKALISRYVDWGANKIGPGTFANRNQRLKQQQLFRCSAVPLFGSCQRPNPSVRIIQGAFIMNKTLFLAGALSAALVGTAHAENLLKVALNADIRSTEPGVNRDTNSDAVILHITEGLVAFREDATVGPLLAKDVQVSDDGLRYTFHLRNGVKFQNGAPLTSADVLWTWKHYLDPKTQWRCAPEFDGHGGAKIVDMSAPDPLTVVFTLDKPNGLFLTSTALPECGGSGILHPDSVVDGQWKAPIGTGPFRLGEWKPGQYIDLLRNANYTPRDEKEPDGYTGNKTTTLDRVRLLVIPDPAAAKAALLSKNVDLLIDVTPLDATELAANPGIKVTSSGT
eukprot:gene20136-23933_t